MLTSDQFDSLTTPILSLYADYETTVIQDIARRLKKLALSSAAWQTQRLIESGALYKNVLKELSRLTGKSEAEIAALLQQAGVKAIAFDDRIYKDAGLNPLPLNLSPAMLDVLKATLNKTNAVMNNLTLTTAVTAQQSFIRAADLAHQQVASGAMSYDQAIRAAVKKVAADGLHTIEFASGHTDQLDVSVRRAVLTGVAQTTAQLQITRAEQMGSDLIAVSAHAGARNRGTGPMNHESWQGKVYSRSGTHKKYPPFVETTGYGTGEGLGGWNCRHSFYPFFEGISEKAYSAAELRALNKEKVTYQGQEISRYEASQIQREIERKIRYWKRQTMALGAAGLDNSGEALKVKEWQARMRGFVNQTGLVRQSVREQVQYANKLPPASAPKPESVAPVVPIAPAPVVENLSGAPVSDALDFSELKSKKIKAQMELALNAINKVHRDGELPKIPIVQGAGRGAFGVFNYSLTSGRPVRIGIAVKGDHQALTAVHEIGHFLDHSATKPQWSSLSIGENNRIVEIAKKSNWWTGFQERVENFTKSLAANVRLNSSYLNYLRGNKEIFARAYAQFIAVESGDPILLAQLKNLQDQKFSTQWSDEDFEPIAEEFRKLFRERGWL